MRMSLCKDRIDLFIKLGRILSASNSSRELSDALQVVSAVARSSPHSYKPLAAAEICEKLVPLLNHPDWEVRAGACNLAGNLCKHSDYFYGAIQRTDLLKILFERCGDEEGNARRMACFAVGNVGRAPSH